MVSFNDILGDRSQRIIFNQIRIHQQISGAELSRITGLQPSTIVYILRALADKNLIEKKGTGNSTNRGGKKPTLWRVRAESFWILGMEILPTGLRAIASSISNSILVKEKLNIKEGINANNLISSIRDLFNKIKNQLTFEAPLIGMGLAIPGIVEMDTGKILYSSSLNLKNFDLASKLEKALSIPVLTSNDANAGALAVQWYPESQKFHHENKIFLMYNQDAKNLGSGIIINNNLFTGSSATAGEIFTPLPQINELIKTGLGLIDQKDVLLDVSNGNTKPDLTEVSVTEQKGCLLSSYILNTICEHIASEIIKITGLLNPDVIVLGGDLPNAESRIKKNILPLVEKEMKSKLKKGYMIPVIQASELKQYAVSMGANALILSAWLDPES